MLEEFELPVWLYSTFAEEAEYLKLPGPARTSA
jgi:hypothetical protein